MPAIRTTHSCGCRNSPTSSRPFSRDLLNRVSQLKRLADLYDGSFWSGWLFRRTKRNRAGRRLPIPSLSELRRHIENDQVTASQNAITSVQSKYSPAPIESGPWVVCSGCFRNWTRQGYYCWDCGYDCWILQSDIAISIPKSDTAEETVSAENEAFAFLVRGGTVGNNFVKNRYRHGLDVGRSVAFGVEFGTLERIRFLDSEQLSCLRS